MEKKHDSKDERFEQCETEFNNDASDIEEDNEAQFIQTRKTRPKTQERQLQNKTKQMVKHNQNLIDQGLQNNKIDVKGEIKRAQSEIDTY